MTTLLTITQVLATIFIAATFFVYVRQAKAMEDQLEISRKSVADMQRSNACRQLYEVIDRLLESRSDIETVLLLKGKSLENWNDAERLSAHRVCSRFHLVGLLLREEMIPEKLFAHAWFYSVPNCFEILRPFIAEVRKSRDSRYWTAFDYLAQRVKFHETTFVGFAEKISP